MKDAHEIAYDLERIVEKVLGYDFDHSGTFFDRDRIHSKYFYSVMFFMLHIKGKDFEGACNFVDKYNKYKDTNIDDIPNYEQIFDEFLKLVDLN